MEPSVSAPDSRAPQREETERARVVVVHRGASPAPVLHLPPQALAQSGGVPHVHDQFPELIHPVASRVKVVVPPLNLFHGEERAIAQRAAIRPATHLLFELLFLEEFLTDSRLHGFGEVLEDGDRTRTAPRDAPAARRILVVDEAARAFNDSAVNTLFIIVVISIADPRVEPGRQHHPPAAGTPVRKSPPPPSALRGRTTTRGGSHHPRRQKGNRFAFSEKTRA
eukprot:8449-Pelagococcus_subviridis.AAC.1